MLSRIPEGEQYASVLDRLARLAQDRNRAQESLASQRRILRPSDDPAAAVRALSLRADTTLAGRYADNAAQATEWNEFAADVLGEVSDALARTREIAVNGANDSLDASDRGALADELDSLREHITALANTEVAGRSLFGGGAQPPVVTQVAGSGAAGFSFSGNSQPVVIAVGPGVSVELGMAADQVFLAQSRRATRYLGGLTGASAGTGTDSATGFGALTVAHTSTTLGDGALAGGDSVTGLRLGASTGNDTVLGAHTIEVFSDSTVALNGGPPVAFTAVDTDLSISGPGGEVVSLDMSTLSATTLAAGATIALQGDGTLSVDDGASAVAIDFTSNQTIRDSRDGTVTHVDSGNVRRAGREDLTYSGTFGILGTLKALSDDLRNTRSLSVQDQAIEISAHLQEVSDGESALAKGFAVLGTAAGRADTARNTADDLQLRFERLRSSLEDVDLAEAILTFKRTEQAYEASLRATAQAQGISLLSFLR